MPAPNAITPDKLVRLVALASAPRIVDLRDVRSKAIPNDKPRKLQRFLRYGMSASVMLSAGSSWHLFPGC